jgi:hypothetical protein
LFKVGFIVEEKQNCQVFGGAAVDPRPARNRGIGASRIIGQRSD